MLRKASRLSLVEQVVMQIESLIEKGHWTVGDKLPPEMELMEEFAVSRNTLREAIRALVHAGLLETKQGSGTLVRSSSSLGAAMERHLEKSNLIETLEVRLALEREAAQLAAVHRNDEDLHQLEFYMEQCRDTAQRDAVEDFISADMAFHKAMVKASHNQLLQELYEYMTDPLYTSISKLMIIDTSFACEKMIHSELLDAIREQNIEEAIKYVNEYIFDFKKRLALELKEEDF
ncbi:FadR/GntR family transcriptional regulator [Bacillus sp. SD088]|uniref:FadR/GntR family transcriptional regulator n=1 Tax=Bacillus sp. SD088 TaxID=2782012 RepID=UPI001A96A096|nr:FadR/GntR family transcriptional regulator [Bacillus sp. SD088]MBO0995411.1 FadR family transcriptional regulator [Bacillus sp. SD088]